MVLFSSCLLGFSRISSLKVFHSLQAGHLPSHLADSYPHELQKKAFRTLAIKIYLFETQSYPITFITMMISYISKITLILHKQSIVDIVIFVSNVKLLQKLIIISSFTTK